MTSRLPLRVAYLDGRRFQRLLLGGIARLVGERGHLDRINVYPVPDGDTGTNLALTFTAVGERLATTDTRHAGELLGIAADAALDGARGNSGAIFAQYLQGLSEFLAGHDRVRPEELALALASAEGFARGAIQNPAEGTVLTVMRDIAAAVAPGALPANADFLTLLTGLLQRAREAVAATRTTLSSMRDAGVEDAGARGLLVLLEGMADALQPGLAPALPVAEDGDPSARSQADYSHVGPPEHRYCTECLVTGEGIDRDGLRSELAQVGSSVVVVGGRAKARLHVHVNDPAEAFGIARRYGKVTAEKADDMLRQERSLLADGRRVAIVADSGADLPPEVWDEFGIQMVPLRVNFGSESHLDKVGMNAAGFWEELARNPVHPKTSQPPPGDYRRAFELLSSHFEHVVSVSVTGRLSGTLQAAQSASTRVSRPGQVSVVDSRNLSVGMGLIVLHAAEQARAGKPVADVVAAVEHAAGRTRTYGAVPDLSYAVRGGRIPQPWRWLAGLLPLGFLLSIDQGSGIRIRGMVRRGGDRVSALVRLATQDRLLKGDSGRVRLAIAHANAPELAAALRTACEVAFPGIELIHVADLGPAYGVHAGPGTIALAVQHL
ncbi:MAG: DegV family EDD domain-containing protein [Gammaproteobacteria bacterium]|jgi:DegV family protein with EDD domain|nr:DegV family EDD domain-containing protein [Gammaproteobacteria bacterium]